MDRQNAMRTTYAAKQYAAHIVRVLCAFSLAAPRSMRRYFNAIQESSSVTKDCTSKFSYEFSLSLVMKPIKSEISRAAR